MIKPIPTSVHGVADYLGGVALLLAPDLFGFAAAGGPGAWVPRVLGVVVLVQSLATRYELGLVKLLPMRLHLATDYAASLFLAASPWLFGFHDRPANGWVPHVAAGHGAFALTLLTRREWRLAYSLTTTRVPATSRASGECRRPAAALDPAARGAATPPPTPTMGRADRGRRRTTYRYSPAERAAWPVELAGITPATCTGSVTTAAAAPGRRGEAGMTGLGTAIER